jgi:hypothetical protein
MAAWKERAAKEGEFTDYWDRWADREFRSHLPKSMTVLLPFVGNLARPHTLIDAKIVAI